jgi:hypothetical protein
MEIGKPASPACSLDEAPDAYRGYLAPQDIAAELAAIAAALDVIGKGDAAARLRLLGGGETPADASPISDIAAAFDRLLPRIADDRLHAALQQIRDKL